MGLLWLLLPQISGGQDCASGNWLEKNGGFFKGMSQEGSYEIRQDEAT
jgi:hypothetical protein